MRTKQWVRIAGASSAAALALTACGSSSKGTSGSGSSSSGSSSSESSSSESSSSGASSSSGGLGGGAASSSSGGLGGGGASTASGGAGAAKAYKIAFEGPLSGTNAQLGINEEQGAQLAVNQANASGKLKFKLSLLKSDDQGDPAKAPAAATAAQQDPTVLGMIGPSFSGATKAVGASYDAAGMAFITPSATAAVLGTGKFAFKTYHRIVLNDNVEGTQGADWLARRGIKSVFVINDLSDYGSGVAATMASGLKTKGVKVKTAGVDAKTTDYSAIATQVASSGAGAVFYGGYDAQAALFAKALVAANYKGIRVTGNGGKSTVFTKGAGTAGNGWYFTCGCEDATVLPAAKSFATAYQAAFKTAPSTYSPEAFDATNAMIEAIKNASETGVPTRATVLAAVNKLDYKGITTTIKFQSNGEVDASGAKVNLYQEKNGVIAFVGDIQKIK